MMWRLEQEGPYIRFFISQANQGFALLKVYGAKSVWNVKIQAYVVCSSDSSDSGQDETGRSGPQSDLVCATLGTTLLLAVAWVALQIFMLIGCCLTLGRRERRRSDRVRLETDFQPKHVTWGDVNQGWDQQL